MYILQEYYQGVWSDFYTHNDYNYLLNVKEIFIKKYPNRKYRVIEVVEDV